MPAIFHQSPGMAARGLSLIDQSIARQPNGLVNVVVKYVAPAANVDQLLPQFTIDSPPPIYPDIIDANELQTRRLYLQNFTADKAAGLATISAQYAGALLRGFSTPHQTNQFENRFITINNRAFLGSLQDAGGGVQNRLSFNDGYVFSYRARIAYYEVAVVGDQNFAIRTPSLVDPVAQDGLIVGWSLVNFKNDTVPPADALLYEGFYRRDFTPEQWLDLMVSQLTGLPWFGVLATTDVDNVTPSVRIYKTRARSLIPRSVTLQSGFAGDQSQTPALPNF
jgi:hypothetical protein